MIRVLAYVALAWACILSGAAAMEPRGTGDMGVVVERANGSLLIIETTNRTVLGRVTGLGDLGNPIQKCHRSDPVLGNKLTTNGAVAVDKLPVWQLWKACRDRLWREPWGVLVAASSDLAGKQLRNRRRRARQVGNAVWREVGRHANTPLCQSTN